MERDRQEGFVKCNRRSLVSRPSMDANRYSELGATELRINNLLDLQYFIPKKVIYIITKMT